jgi:glutathione S-transferase
MLKLYYSPGACALASHIALEEAGAEYEAVKVDLSRGEQKAPEYLAINPAGVTPALATDSGVLTENLAIMWYVAALYPEAGLLPEAEETFETARMHAFNAYLSSALHPAIGRALFSRPALEGGERDQALAGALARYDHVERHLLTGPWVLGERYTIADGYLSVFSRWLRLNQLLDKDRFPKLNAHLTLVQSRPCVQKALLAEGVQPA